MGNQPYPPDSGPGQSPYYGRPDEPTMQAPRPGASYQQRRQEHYSGPQQQAPVNQYEQRTETVEDRNMKRAYLRNWISSIIYFILAVLEVIMLLRFIFRLLGANQSSGFVSFLYNLSHVFVAPFNGIFNDQTLGHVSVFEVSTLVAMLIYALVGWGIVSLVRVLLAPTLNDERNVTWTRRGRY